MSPIAVRQISKRRYTGSNGNGGNAGNVSSLESDGEGPGRLCFCSSHLFDLFFLQFFFTFGAHRKAAMHDAEEHGLFVASNPRNIIQFAHPTVPSALIVLLLFNVLLKFKIK